MSYFMVCAAPSDGEDDASIPLTLHYLQIEHGRFINFLLDAGEPVEEMIDLLTEPILHFGSFEGRVYYIVPRRPMYRRDYHCLRSVLNFRIATPLTWDASRLLRIATGPAEIITL